VKNEGVVKIIIIVPSNEIKKDFSEILEGVSSTELQYKPLFITREDEQQVPRLGGDVVISRGFSAAFLKTQNTPAVELYITGYDLILAVQKCISRYQCTHLAIIGTESVPFENIEFELFFPEIQIDCYRADTRKTAVRYMEMAVEKGATAIIGGTSVCEAAARKNIPCVPFEHSRESILESVNMAIQLVKTIRSQRAEAEYVKKIMDYSFCGILSTDAKGYLYAINRKACEILGERSEGALGEHISRVIPGVNIRQVLQDKLTLTDELCRVGNKLISINCVPIGCKSSPTGAVITCQEVQELQRSEAKIRKKVLQKGFVAHYHFSDIMCQDIAMRSIIQQASRFSDNHANILIYGETGVGKELFAQAIHNASARSAGPFVAINCAALPEQLLESELFGYVGGAFTGAARGGKVGLFEAAHGGTIFLDEIGDISPKLQSRLLRVLQEKEIVRLGDDQVIPVDVRVLSATNKRLNEEVEKGTFRSDLMYRLDVLRLTIPPLRQRRQDILPLMWSFLKEYREQEQGSAFKTIQREAAELLENYPWYGNVRQLRNVAQRLSILCIGEEITSEAVQEALDLPRNPFAPTVAESEAMSILEALQKANYRKGEAAKLLNMDRSTLYRKMQKYNLK